MDYLRMTSLFSSVLIVFALNIADAAPIDSFLGSDTVKASQVDLMLSNKSYSYYQGFAAKLEADAFSVALPLNSIEHQSRQIEWPESLAFEVIYGVSQWNVPEIANSPLARGQSLARFSDVSAAYFGFLQSITLHSVFLSALDSHQDWLNNAENQEDKMMGYEGLALPLIAIALIGYQIRRKQKEFAHSNLFTG